MSRCATCHCQPCRCDMFALGQPPGLAGNTPSGWPLTCEALAVGPDQIPAAMERNKRHGVQGISYDKDGCAIVADQGAYRDLMALEGCHLNNGGYGTDHAGQSPLYLEADNQPEV